MNGEVFQRVQGITSGFDKFIVQLLNEKRGDFFGIGDFHPVFLTQTQQGGRPSIGNDRILMNNGDRNQVMSNRPSRAGIKNVAVTLVPRDRNNACKCLRS